MSGNWQTCIAREDLYVDYSAHAVFIQSLAQFDARSRNSLIIATRHGSRRSIAELWPAYRENNLAALMTNLFAPACYSL